MTQRQPNLDDSSRFARLMQQGQAAQNANNPRRAHRFWREAAMLNPTSEAVWQALLTVLDNEHDRQVCLQNIVAINPNNLNARQELFQYNEDTKPSAPILLTQESMLIHRNNTRETVILIMRLVGAMLFGVFLAVAIVFVFSILPV
ncbi:MAG: tetratricopeptide repeat protein [Aggregatilineales bacterium]